MADQFDDFVTALQDQSRLKLERQVLNAQVHLFGEDQVPEDYAPTPLARGLYLLDAVAGAGKTLHMRAFATALRLCGYHAEYRAIMEPRGQYIPTVATPQTDASESTVPAWGDYYRDWAQKAASRRVSSSPVLIADSLTFLLRALPETQAAIKAGGGRGSFEKGLSAEDTLGTLHHQLRAEEYNVAFVAVLNSTLYPVATMLDGAAEGRITIVAEGVLRIHARFLGRQSREFKIPDGIMRVVKGDMGIPLNRERTVTGGIQG